MEDEKNNIEPTFSIKGIDKKNEMDFMIDLINERIHEKNKFNEPDHEIKSNYFISTTYCFKQDIERVWMILRCFELISLISNEGHYPCIFLKGKDTWKVGNIFKGNLYGIFPFIAKVEKSVNLPDLKKLKWIFNIKDNDYFIIKLELFKVTGDNKTVVLEKIMFEKYEIYQEANEKINKSQKFLIFQHIEKILEKEAINLLTYESGIIKGQMKDIWDIITDFNKLTAIAPNNNHFPNISLKDLKIGEKKETYIFYNNKEIKKFDITLKCKYDKPGWNKWLMVCEILGGYPTKVSSHISILQLTKINDDECQLSLLTKYHDPIDNKKFKIISDRKKYLLLSIKDYFENFFCPNSSN
jgi:hypothetical protein